MLAARRKPIGGRKELKSEYTTPEGSTQGSTAESQTSDRDNVSVKDNVEYSFYKRRRSEDTGSERSGGIVKRRRSMRNKRPKSSS